MGKIIGKKKTVSSYNVLSYSALVSVNGEQLPVGVISTVLNVFPVLPTNIAVLAVDHLSFEIKVDFEVLAFQGGGGGALL